MCQSSLNHLTRPMQPADLAGVLQVQRTVYPPALLENTDFFLNRLQLAGPLCRVAVADDNILGYLVSYPWHSGLPPKLNLPLAALPADADCWFIHDCAVSPAAQGQGVAQRLLQDTAQAARQMSLAASSLVALADAVDYWRRQGYQAREITAAALAGYGNGARFMARDGFV